MFVIRHFIVNRDALSFGTSTHLVQGNYVLKKLKRNFLGGFDFFFFLRVKEKIRLFFA